ncbi:MAG: macrolide family glycosyltransferase [Acutalibacteraceae bacterium]|nr:macrolide family glycosyltransferase [Acutalibacteraceae bacterium]MEE1249500.1 macrolide family glycosyltransferase [Lachnospiraceae bacterium]
MKKIVFFCIPAHGHTNPTLGVVRELISRGHQVWYYSYNIMREKIESTGATFISCDDYDMEQKLTPKDAVRIGKDLAFSTKILVDTTLALDDKVCADMEQLKPDCIVADSMAVWGKAVAMKLGIPFVSSTTTFAFNQHSAKIMKQSIGELFKMIFSMPNINKQIKRLQNKGYPVKSVLDIIQNDDKTHTVVYTSPEFQPCSETFSDKYSFVGPSIRPITDKIEKKMDKLIYISMGTVNNDMMPFYKRCLSALANQDYQVIMSVGNLVSIKDFGELPKNISIFSYVDQIAVLQQADVFVSHCGMNSVNESIYFGVPLIMLPQTSEQGGVAERVHQLGAGIKLDKSDTTSILGAINKVFADSIYRQNATILSEGFKRCSGAKGAANKIMQVCENTL